MTSENVAVDEPVSRPVGAQLAVLADRAAAAPGDAVERIVFHELPAAWNGAGEWVRDWQWWVNARAERAEIERKVARAQANGSGAMPVPFQEVAALRKARYLKSAIIAAGVLAALAGCSVLGFWSWHPWRWWGPGLALGLLAAGKYYGRSGRWVARLSWVPIPVFMVAGIEGWRWWPWWVAAGVLALACEQRGLRMAKEMPGPAPAQAARSGMSLSKLWATIEGRLAEERVTATRQHTRILVVHGEEVGAAFGLTTREKLKPEVVESIAREVHVGRKWVRYVHPADEPVGELVVHWADPLSAVPGPPFYQFGAVTYCSQLSLGQDDTGATELLSVAYTNVLVFGRIGSGKSSVVRLIIVAVEAMPDVDLYGIDTAGFSTLGPQKRRLGADRVACGAGDVPAALRILDRLLAEADRRSDALDNGEDWDEDGEVDDRFRVCDQPGRRGIVLLIGEFHDFCAHAELVDRLLRLASKARKTAISVVVESPTLAKETLGEGRHLIRMMMVRIAMSCTNSDVVQGLGVGALDEGWRPDHLQPESEGVRNDAGVGYVWGGGRNRPRLTGFHPMDPSAAKARREAIRPQRNRWYGLPDDAPGDPRSTRPEGAGEDVVDAVEVPEALVWLESAMGTADRVTSDEAARVAGVSTQALAAALRPHGVRPDKWRVGSDTERGYTRSALVSAMERLT